jgi:hypothetical protein
VKPVVTEIAVGGLTVINLESLLNIVKRTSLAAEVLAGIRESAEEREKPTLRYVPRTAYQAARVSWRPMPLSAEAQRIT